MRKFALGILGVLMVLGFCSTAQAQDVTYHFGTSGKHTNISFESETDFEQILGSTNQLKGWVKGDMAAGTGSLLLKVPVASLNTGIEMRDDHLRSPNWMDAEKFPYITFKSSSFKNDGKTWSVTGDFTMHGVTKTMTVDVKVRNIAEEKAVAAGIGKGNWLRVTTTFTVKLSDYGITVPDRAAAKVSDTWTIKISAFATTDATKATLTNGCNGCNPCGACNPCAKTACNPCGACNPCAKKACNPCGK
jgi:polyisoprenoid-binding protein YceI